MENPPLPASHLTHRLRCLLSRTRVRMRSNSRDPMSPGFEWRLKAALDRVTPPYTQPRYLSLAAARPLRLAPFVLAAAASALLALSATAATGSPNPVVWTERATATIESVGHAPANVTSPEPSPNRSSKSPRSGPAAPSTHQPEHRASPTPEPSERPEESPLPEPTESPRGDAHSGPGPGTSTPRPSPSPSPRPSPTPDDD